MAQCARCTRTGATTCSAAIAGVTAVCCAIKLISERERRLVEGRLPTWTKTPVSPCSRAQEVGPQGRKRSDRRSWHTTQDVEICTPGTCKSAAESTSARQHSWEQNIGWQKDAGREDTLAAHFFVSLLLSTTTPLTIPTIPSLGYIIRILLPGGGAWR